MDRGCEVLLPWGGGLVNEILWGGAELSDEAPPPQRSLWLTGARQTERVKSIWEFLYRNRISDSPRQQPPRSLFLFVPERLVFF